MHKVTSVGDDVDDDIYIMVKCMSACMYVTFLLILPSPKSFHSRRSTQAQPAEGRLGPSDDDGDDDGDNDDDDDDDDVGLNLPVEHWPPNVFMMMMMMMMMKSH